MTATLDAEAPRRTRRPDGPPAGMLACLTLVFSVGAVLIPLGASGVPFPSPQTSASAAAAYFADHTFAGVLTGVLSFAASVPLGIYAATLYARQLRLGIRVAGPGISLFGGITASILLAISSLVTWTLASTQHTDATTTQVFATLTFALGGVGFASGIGLLIAGIAVPTLILRLSPRWIGWVGLTLAVVGEVSFLALIWDGFDALLPITRFAGVLWLAVMGFALPHDRREVRDRGSRRPTALQE